MRHWLMKSEPGCFSIRDLAALPQQTTMWDGVRNYQARNFMRDDMQVGDPVFFYNSITDVGIAGIAEVASAAYPDPTQWDPAAQHYDAASSKEAPRWYLVDIHLVTQFAQVLPLALLRIQPELAGMELLRKGSRLSVQPVKPHEFEVIVELARTYGA